MSDETYRLVLAFISLYSWNVHF